MTEILLIACNARYSHTAVSSRFLRANLQHLRENSEILEFTISNEIKEAVLEVLAKKPKIVALSVYIWNVDFFRSFVEMLKVADPSILIFLGGPEIADIAVHRSDSLYALSDCLIMGEGEVVFRELCENALAGLTFERVVQAKAVDLSQIILPYDEYSDEDIEKRVIYVESSRGCPYRCSFCLSANERGLRYYERNAFFSAMEKLYERGVRSFKFLDRSLNASQERAVEILNFFLAKADTSLRLHFEMIPYLISEELFEILAKFPPACIQLEIGVQTLNATISRQISRPLQQDRLLENLSRLATQTKCHIHADLIAGLPGEDYASFAKGFDLLYHTGVQEIQLGILKRLKGSPLARVSDELSLQFSSQAPYEILQSKEMSFSQLVRLSRMARYWDRVVNSGNFAKSAKILCENNSNLGVFENFMRFSDWVFEQCQTSLSISLTRWVALLFTYLCETQQLASEVAALLVLEDYLSQRKEDIPKILRPHIPKDYKISQFRTKHSAGEEKAHKRQLKHATNEIEDEV